MPMTIYIVMKVCVARRVAARKRRTLAPSKEQRDAKESGKWAAAKIREDFRRRAGVFEARSSPGIELMNNNLGIAVIFGARHDADSSSPAWKTTTQVIRVVARFQPRA